MWWQMGNLRSYQGLDKWFKPDVTLKANILEVPGLSYQQTIGYENRQWEEHTYRSLITKRNRK